MSRAVDKTYVHAPNLIGGTGLTSPAEGIIVSLPASSGWPQRESAVLEIGPEC